MEINQITSQIIGAAMRVHTELGPGLLESAYEGCLAFELTSRNIEFGRQVALPVVYCGNRIDVGYRLDLLVADLVIVEIKAVERILPIHEAQLMTFLKLADKRVGLILNFNVLSMQDGITRRVNKL